MNEHTARSTLMQAITGERTPIPQADLQTAATVLSHSQQFQRDLSELASALETEEVELLPDWQASVRAYVKAQLTGQGNLDDFHDVQQQLARSVELTAGYLALYDDMAQQYQQRRKLIELGLMLLVSIPFLGAALRLFQQDRPELGLPLLALTFFGMGFAIAAQFTPRPLSQLLRQELFGSYLRIATSTAIVALFLVGGYGFQALVGQRATTELTEAPIAPTSVLEEMGSEIEIPPTTSSHSVTEWLPSIIAPQPTTDPCAEAVLLQPNQPVRQEIAPNETDLYRVEITDTVTLALSLLVAPSTITPLNVHAYDSCVDGRLTGERIFQQVRNQPIDLNDPQSALSIPAMQQRFTLHVAEAQGPIFIQLQSQHENRFNLFYLFSNTTE